MGRERDEAQTEAETGRVNRACLWGDKCLLRLDLHAQDAKKLKHIHVCLLSCSREGLEIILVHQAPSPHWFALVEDHVHSYDIERSFTGQESEQGSVGKPPWRQEMGDKCTRSRPAHGWHAWLDGGDTQA